MCIESQYTINGVTYDLFICGSCSLLEIVTPELQEGNTVLYNRCSSDPNLRKPARAKKYLAGLGTDVLAALVMGLIENAEDMDTSDHC
jgi:hypothetical protein